MGLVLFWVSWETTVGRVWKGSDTIWFTFQTSHPCLQCGDHRWLRQGVQSGSNCYNLGKSVRAWSKWRWQRLWEMVKAGLLRRALRGRADSRLWRGWDREAKEDTGRHFESADHNPCPLPLVCSPACRSWGLQSYMLWVTCVWGHRYAYFF